MAETPPVWFPCYISVRGGGCHRKWLWEGLRDVQNKVSAVPEEDLRDNFISNKYSVSGFTKELRNLISDKKSSFRFLDKRITPIF